MRDVALAGEFDGIDIAYGHADHVPALANPRVVTLELRFTLEVDDTHAVTGLAQDLPNSLNAQGKDRVISRHRQTGQVHQRDTCHVYSPLAQRLPGPIAGNQPPQMNRELHLRRLRAY
ncbi:hypothetical protein Cs7R123_63420 [Catellatospora sp. TT07R-123]|nr:hypothetical protein Cs7R123_63420 [Catellatospora sp. TT07R-123]